jgi:hypothetical protein
MEQQATIWLMYDDEAQQFNASDETGYIYMLMD